MFQGLRPFALTESDPDAEADRHRPSYGTWSSSHAKEPASAPVRDSMEPGLTLPGSGIGQLDYLSVSVYMLCVVV